MCEIKEKTLMSHFNIIDEVSQHYVYGMDLFTMFMIIYTH